MPLFTFSMYDEGFSTSVDIEATTWDEILDPFFLFLKGSGFLFDINDKVAVINNEGIEKEVPGYTWTQQYNWASTEEEEKQQQEPEPKKKAPPKKRAPKKATTA